MSKIVPTKADREAAQDAYLTCFEIPPNDLWLSAMIAGKHDDDPLVQAFARHAVTARQEALGEAARVAEAHSNMQCGPYTREVTTAVAAAIRSLSPLPNPERDLEAEAREEGR